MRTLTLRRSTQTSFFRYVVDLQSYGSSMGKILASFRDSMELIRACFQVLASMYSEAALLARCQVNM